MQDWGPIDYEKALEQQLLLVDQVHSQNLAGIIVFCTHPPIVTLGRKTQAGDVFAWPGEIKEISRGGRATYHGPSQLLIYPIINLDLVRPHRPLHDIGKFLRNFEQAIVNTLSKFGVAAQGKSLQKKSEVDATSEETGVWVENRKVGSLGIGIKKWVTYHGAAINLDNDPQAFQGMNPCGFSAQTMISLEELIGKKIDREKFQKLLFEQLLHL